jgi:hypothetical protein
MAARKMTAPNSNVRAFQVERVCDRYRRQSRGLVGVAVSEELLRASDDLGLPVEGDVSDVMSGSDAFGFEEPAPWREKTS